MFKFDEVLIQFSGRFRWTTELLQRPPSEVVHQRSDVIQLQVLRHTRPRGHICARDVIHGLDSADRGQWRAWLLLRVEQCYVQATCLGPGLKRAFCFCTLTFVLSLERCCSFTLLEKAPLKVVVKWKSPPNLKLGTVPDASLDAPAGDAGERWQRL